ncbi:MAG: hypothetical protein IPN70_02915 [Candidatus Moraniibacteriota bacterium]|nr:MAG: hypothetical protein IPN70_02915 [Candidatus Moranbacteria bacterium]
MNNDDLKKIKKYIGVAEKIRNSNFIKNTKQVSFKMNIEIDKPVRFESTGFDEDLLKSALMDFRKIYMKKDSTNFFRIYNLIYKNTDDIAIKNNIEKCREIYAKILSRPTSIGIYINKELQNVEKIIDDWLYGYYFHEDDEREEKMQAIMIGQLFHRASFVTSIIDLMKIAIVMSNNAKKIISEYES